MTIWRDLDILENQGLLREFMVAQSVVEGGVTNLRLCCEQVKTWKIKFELVKLRQV